MPRAITHPSPKVPQRETTPESLSKARAFGNDVVELKAESEPSPAESIVSASLKLSIEQARSKFAGPAKPRPSSSKEQPQCQSSSDVSNAETYQLTFPSVRATAGPFESAAKPASSRAASKIPTPLSRTKTAKSTSSDSALTPSSSVASAGSPKASPSKAHPVSGNKSSTSQAPCSLPRTSAETFAACATVESASSSQASLTEQQLVVVASRIPSARCHEEAAPAATERRRTVVEVCEKVVVPQGKASTAPPVTPFITVNRVSDKQQSPVTEVRHDQQQQSTVVNSNASKKS